MKFFSKASNYGLVLKPGRPANQMTGDPGQAGIRVKFEHGIAEVNDEKTIELMLAHPKFGVDFFQPDTPASADPYAHRRQGDTQHDIIEFEYGRPKKVTKSTPKLQPEILKFIHEESTRLAEEKFGELVEAFENRMKERNQEIEPQSDDDITDEEVSEDEEKKAPKKKAPSTKKKKNTKSSSKNTKKKSSPKKKNSK